MPFFEVTFTDGSTTILEAHTQRLLRAALQEQQAPVTRIRYNRRCTRCHRAPATVRRTLCQSCWDTILTECQSVWSDTPMTEQELQDLALSFFVDG